MKLQRILKFTDKTEEEHHAIIGAIMQGTNNKLLSGL